VPVHADDKQVYACFDLKTVGLLCVMCKDALNILNEYKIQCLLIDNPPLCVWVEFNQNMVQAVHSAMNIGVILSYLTVSLLFLSIPLLSM
jgi:hypothetical protein